VKRILYNIKISFFYLLAVVGYTGCAGTKLNPYIEDMYGVKRHMINDVVILLDVRKLSEGKNRYEFKFYEPVLAVDPIRKRARQKTINHYYDQFSKKNGFGTNYQKIGGKLNYPDNVKYYYTIIYTDSGKVKNEKYTEPGLIEFNTLLKPDL